MKSETVEITSKSIQRILKKFTPERAIAEYVWNGFDANATEVSINIIYSDNEFGLADSIEIKDNGDGICHEQLDEKFKVFYDSAKKKKSTNNSDLIRGKNGYGRLTFFKFARLATWSTCYQSNGINYCYDIRVRGEDLRHFTSTNNVLANEHVTGTKVVFNDINTEISSIYVTEKVIPYLTTEFAWFLEVRKDVKILISVC